MDAIEQLRQDARLGWIDFDRLIDLLVVQQRQLEASQRELKAARQRIEELEKKIGGPNPPVAGAAKVDEPFSMRAEDKRQQERLKNDKRQLSRKARRSLYGFVSGSSPTFRMRVSSSWEMTHSPATPRPHCFFSARTRPRRHHLRTVNSALPIDRSGLLLLAESSEVRERIEALVGTAARVSVM